MSDAGERPQRTDELLAVLARAGIEHVVIGGVAAIAWGGSELTRDLDIVMPFDVEHATDGCVRAVSPEARDAT